VFKPNQIPFDLPGFAIDTVKEYPELLIIEAHSTQTEAPCPACQSYSSSVHSYYTRCPRDLPSGEYQLRLVLRVHRFRCQNSQCAKKTCAERLPDLVPVHGQRTYRLTEKLYALVFESSAEGCARQTQTLGMEVSADTLLRIIRQRTILTQNPTQVGIDDWAYCKGIRYGTLVVDLESNRPVDLLPDRTTDTVATWLKNHPGITIISRDRSSEYRAAATIGAPKAIQVADRWHLLRNLFDAVERLIKSHASILHATAKSLHGDPQSALTTTPEKSADPQPSVFEARFIQAKQLAAEGYSRRSLARQLGMSRNTVKRYMTMQTFHYGPRRRRPTMLDSYIPYIEKRWDEGCHNSRILWEELQQRGFSGSYGTVRCFVQRYRKELPTMTAASVVTPHPIWSPHQTAWLLFREPATLAFDESAFVSALCATVSEIAIAYILIQLFLTIVRQRLSALLDPWMKLVSASTISSLKSFVSGLRTDYEAVRAALEYPFSNGPVEGHINRLKTIKRMMYGRGKFDLLKLRVLHPT